MTRGFSLLEVIIAMMMFFILLTAVLFSSHFVVSGRKILELKAEEYRIAASVCEKFKSEGTGGRMGEYIFYINRVEDLTTDSLASFLLKGLSGDGVEDSMLGTLNQGLRHYCIRLALSRWNRVDLMKVEVLSMEDQKQPLPSPSTTLQVGRSA